MPCHNPFTINVKGHDYQVPCRWCLGCRIDRRNHWSFRMRFEMYTQLQKGYRSSFLTLTYNDDNCPNSLVKKDVQDFLKRLRYYLSKSTSVKNNSKFKYYCVGEYGDGSRTNQYNAKYGTKYISSHRPHYHLCFFGLESNFLKKYSRKSWDFGFITCSPLNPTRINYCLNYIDQEIADFKSDYDSSGRLYPFSLFSKGIGSDYFQQHRSEIESNGVVLNSNRFVKIPVYYSKKFGIDEEVIKCILYENLKLQAERNGLSLYEYMIKRNYNSELVQMHRLQLKGRGYNHKYLDCARSFVEQHDNKNNYDVVNNILGDLYET